MSVEVGVGEHLYNHRSILLPLPAMWHYSTGLQLVLAHNDHQLNMYITLILSHMFEIHASRWHSQIRQGLRVHAFLMRVSKKSQIWETWRRICAKG